MAHNKLIITFREVSLTSFAHKTVLSIISEYPEEIKQCNKPTAFLPTKYEVSGVLRILIEVYSHRENSKARSLQRNINILLISFRPTRSEVRLKLYKSFSQAKSLSFFLNVNAP